MPINYNNYTSIRLPTSIIVHDTFFLPRADAGLLALQMRLQKLGDQEHSHSGDQPSCTEIQQLSVQVPSVPVAGSKHCTSRKMGWVWKEVKEEVKFHELGQIYSEIYHDIPVNPIFSAINWVRFTGIYHDIPSDVLRFVKGICPT